MVTTDEVGDHDDDDRVNGGGGGGGGYKVSRSCRSGSGSGQTGLQLASIVSTTTAAKVGESLSFLVLLAPSSSVRRQQQLPRFQADCCFGHADAGQLGGSSGSKSEGVANEADGVGVVVGAGNGVMRIRMMKREEEKNVCHYRRFSRSSSKTGSTGFDVGNIYKWCRKVVVRGMRCHECRCVLGVLVTLLLASGEVLRVALTADHLRFSREKASALVHLYIT